MEYYLYSNLSDMDYTDQVLQDLSKKVKYIICDFDNSPTKEVTGFSSTSHFIDRLNKYNMGAYFRLPKLCYEPGLDIIRSKVEYAYCTGFSGVCLDGEAYSNWSGYAEDFFEKACEIGIEIKKKFNEVILFPENLGGIKYKNYDTLIFGLIHAGLKVTVFMERTYKVWRPLQLFHFLKRNTDFISIDFVIGIHNPAFNWFCAIIQMLSAYVLARIWKTDKVFLYTEAMTVDDSWRGRLSKGDEYPFNKFYMAILKK